MVGKTFFATDPDRVNRAAMALFDCDEDMTDENILDIVSRGGDPALRSIERQRWDELIPETRAAYRRRAKSVLAAAEYPQSSERKSRA